MNPIKLEAFMQAHETAGATGFSSPFSALAEPENPELLRLVFDKTYQCGQEIGVAFGDEFFLYEVTASDVGGDPSQTQANVALTVLRAPALHAPEVCRDIAWARSLWSN